MHALESVTEAIDAAVAGFEPENANDLGSFLERLPDIYQSLASALTTVADRFGDEFPVNPEVSEHLREMASGAAGQQEYAAEMHGIFRTSHASELERLEDPRPNERLWDVVENQ